MYVCINLVSHTVVCLVCDRHGRRRGAARQITSQRTRHVQASCFVLLLTAYLRPTTDDYVLRPAHEKESICIYATRGRSQNEE